MALIYGTDGIKQKDYEVYIAKTTAGITDTVDVYKAAANKTNLATLMGLLTQLGECRADSITVTAEDGDSIEGNILGNIVLNKACAMATELINATPNNISELESLDGSPVTIVIREKDTHGSNLKTVILIHNIVMSYTENITGGDIIRSSISLSRNTPTVSSFRHIADIDHT